MKKKSQKDIFASPLHTNPDHNTLHDPQVLYGESRPTLKLILGNKENKEWDTEDLTLIKLTRDGITRKTLYSVAKYMGITLEEMASLLHTTYRNLIRKDGNALIDPLKSEKVIELAKFSQFGVQALNSHENFKSWLRGPIMALNFNKPLDYLDTSFGVNHLTNLLGRIQYGVYS